MPLLMLRSAAMTRESSMNRMSKSPPPVDGNVGFKWTNVLPPSVERHRSAGSASELKPSTSTTLPLGETETLGSPPAFFNVVVANASGAEDPAGGQVVWAC